MHGSTTLQSFGYSYDAAGNRISVTDRNAETTTYAYDELNRLIEFDLPTEPTMSYAYDSAGNRIDADRVTYVHNALNQITSDSAGTTYVYDNAGRLVERTNGSEVTTYVWNPLDQLLEVDDGSDSIAYEVMLRSSDRNA